MCVIHLSLVRQSRPAYYINKNINSIFSRITIVGRLCVRSVIMLCTYCINILLMISRTGLPNRKGTLRHCVILRLSFDSWLDRDKQRTWMLTRSDRFRMPDNRRCSISMRQTSGLRCQANPPHHFARDHKAGLLFISVRHSAGVNECELLARIVQTKAHPKRK